MTGSLACVCSYWDLLGIDYRVRVASKQHYLFLWRIPSWASPALASPDHRLTRDHQSQETAGAGVRWSAGREPNLTRLVVHCQWPVLISDCDSWSCDITLWSIPCHTYLEFVDLLRRLLTKINRCHACLVSTLHWAQQPAGLATHYVVKLFIVLQHFKHHRNLEKKVSELHIIHYTMNIVTLYRAVKIYTKASGNEKIMSYFLFQFILSRMNIMSKLCPTILCTLWSA